MTLPPARVMHGHPEGDVSHMAHRTVGHQLLEVGLRQSPTSAPYKDAEDAEGGDQDTTRS